VDSIIEEWQREFPDTDQSAKAITTRLVRLGALIDNVRRAELGKLGITSGEYAVLATLRRMGPPYRRAPRELARDLSITSAGVTAALDRVGRKGLVERTGNPADRRGSLVCLTASGRRLTDDAMAQQIALDHRLVAGLDPTDRRTLTPLLRTLLRRLEPRPPSSA
jgi:DNA-binding MarR family transcriptional regulator